MELSNYYSLDECSDRKLVIQRLNELKKDGKIDYNIDVDLLEIDDIDLDENEVDELDDFLYENDVMPYLERDDHDDDYDGFYDDDDYRDYDDY